MSSVFVSPFAVSMTSATPPLRPGLANTLAQVLVPQVTEVSPDRLQHWLERGEVILLDVREADEHAAESIPGSRSLPMGQVCPERLPNERWVLYCRSGNRSARVGQRLLNLGLAKVLHLDGGLLAWKAAGHDTERGSLDDDELVAEASPESRVRTITSSG